MKDIGIGLLGLSVDEYYSITLGNLSRMITGWVKNTWLTQREVIAALYNQWGGDVTAEDVFPFGAVKEPKKLTPEDREFMDRRHENTLRIQNG